MKILKDKVFYLFSVISLPLTAPLMGYVIYNRILPMRQDIFSMEFSWIKWYFFYVLPSFEFLITTPFGTYGFGSLESYKLMLFSYLLWIITSFILGYIFYLIFSLFRK